MQIKDNVFLFPLSLASTSWRAPGEGAGIGAEAPTEGSVGVKGTLCRGSGAAPLPGALP